MLAMIKKYIIITAGILLLTVQMVSADEQSDCQDNCGKKMEECIARIDKANEIEIKELKQQCEDTQMDCNHYCDGRGDDPHREEKERAAREQQESGSQIKTFKLDN
jgi:uncharacterized hydantoinase/oxoprolinase family protein